MYPDGAGPRYIVAMSVNCVMVFLAICMATLLRFILVRLNKKLESCGIPIRYAINLVTVASARTRFMSACFISFDLSVLLCPISRSRSFPSCPSFKVLRYTTLCGRKW